jgi:hypothetical protein
VAGSDSETERAGATPRARRQRLARFEARKGSARQLRGRARLGFASPHPVHHGKSVERAGRGGTAPAPLPCPSDGRVGRHRCDLLGYLARPAPTALQGGQLRRHDDSSVGSYCCHTCSGYVHRMIIMCDQRFFRRCANDGPVVRPRAGRRKKAYAVYEQSVENRYW